MSLRSFTVFQDAAPTEEHQPKVSRPRAMTTRSTTRNILSSKSATATEDAAPLDKENYNPVTGERAGPSAPVKKRKTVVLSAKPLPPAKTKKGQDVHSEPEQKKRKASALGVMKPTISSTSKAKSKKEVKGSGSAKKVATRRTGLSKVSLMPKLEEEEGEKEHATQADIDSRCYELTVKPLADVSQAYEESTIFDGFANAVSAGSDEKVKFEKVKFGTAKASSVEPEIRDYFQPSQALFCPPAASRMRAFSEEPTKPRTFSTPERKQIYAAFTFCSPTASTTLTSKASRSGTISPFEES